MGSKKFRYMLTAIFAVASFGISTDAASASMEKLTVNSDIQDTDLIINPDEMSEGDPVLPSFRQRMNIDVEKTGEITVRLTEGKEDAAKAGVRFSCDKAAEFVQGEFVLTETYRESGVDLNRIENSAEMETSASQLAEFMGVADGKEVNENGEVIFQNLDTGVYLIKAEENPDYDIVSPSLVAIPMWDENEGEMCYETILEPKHTPRQERPETPEPGEKVREAPQTGVEDHTIVYLGAAAICFLCACLLWMGSMIKKRGKRK